MSIVFIGFGPYFLAANVWSQIILFTNLKFLCGCLKINFYLNRGISLGRFTRLFFNKKFKNLIKTSLPTLQNV